MPSSIEWLKQPDGSQGSSWNVVTGCKPDFPCWQRCYARRMAQRLAGRYGYPRDDPFAPTFHPDKLDQPLHWKKPRTIFVSSMGDLFADGVKREWQDAVIDVILADTPHTFILLTKRVKEAGEYLSRLYLPDFGERLVIGTSVSNQAEWDERVPLLCSIPAWRRVVSVEPMLGPIAHMRQIRTFVTEEYTVDPEIHGVICGCETGPGARPCHPAWIRSLRDQCVAAGASFFFKSWGEWMPTDPATDGWALAGSRLKTEHIGEQEFYRVGKKRAGRILDGREHNDVAWGRKEKS